RRGPGGGGILVDITLEAAYAALRAEPTQLKHLLLFSDGQDSEDMRGTRAMVQAAARDRITTSVVSMGTGPDTPELEQLSRIGGGRFYIVEDMRELPRIFTQETIEASRAALREEPFRASVATLEPIVEGLDFGSSPPLGGHAIVSLRPGGTEVLHASEEDPLLARWQHGIGRSAVFTTDAGAELGRPWLEWPGYGVLFSQLARDLARAPEPGDANVHLVLRGGVGRIVVEALSQDGSYRNYLELEAAVIGPDGQPIEANLTQTGAGRYEGRFEASVPGPYLVTVREGEELVGGAGVLRPAGDELRGEGTDRALLGRLAALGGGVVRDDLSAVFEDRPPATWAYDPLWQRLLMASLCLLLLSVALRRLILPTAWLMRLLPAPLRRRLGGGAEGGAARGASSERGRSLEALEALAARRGGGAGPEPAAPLAEELRAALAPLGRGSERAEPPEPAPAAATGEPPPAPAEGAQPPTSLAEQLLARKRKRP
ncbi:MAG: hypothetical protein OEY14_10625, partial [Myxococcales bacterium]|nr:hypothetical protein [Myxococcales bacterium]